MSETFGALATERLTLRPYHAEDAAELHRLINDWEVCRALAAVPFPYPRSLADEWIVSAARLLAAGRAYHLAVTGREADREVIVGGVGLRIDAAKRCGRLGYWVGRRFWGHGVAPEAAGRLARWALANLALDLLEATVATDNARSIAVLHRIGFKQIGKGHETFLARASETRCFTSPPTAKISLAPQDRPQTGWNGRCCSLQRARSSTRTAACCSRAGQRARKWRVYGSSLAASSGQARRPRLR